MATFVIPDICWPENAAEAIAQQRDLQAQVRLSPFGGPLRSVAGIDVSHDKNGTSHAAIVLLDAESLQPRQGIRLSAPTRFPYIPGLLSFREIPVILQALARLETAPDLLMVDGQGIAHPRRLGIAAHLGVLLDLPAIGVAKSRLYGRHGAVGPRKGDHVPLTGSLGQIGTVLRSKENCLPLYISPGHRTDQEQALALTLRFLTRYRLPEPTRLADKLSKRKDGPNNLL